MIYQQDTATLFSILHDGEIFAHSVINDTLLLTVTIPYLAERIHPAFTVFTVVLHQVRSIALYTWPRRQDAESKVVTQAEYIFQAPLDILEARFEDEKLVVACAQTEPNYDYVGGTLVLAVDAVTVVDEANTSYSIEMLTTLAQAYWNDWRNSKK